jgi:hypothetical protein
MLGILGMCVQKGSGDWVELRLTLTLTLANANPNPDLQMAYFAALAFCKPTRLTIGPGS